MSKNNLGEHELVTALEVGACSSVGSKIPLCQVHLSSRSPPGGRENVIEFVGGTISPTLSSKKPRRSRAFQKGDI